MKQFFYILFFIFSTNLSAQEICNNGIDDDGDTFIDLNDTADCSCVLATPPSTVISLIPNPSFEQRNCCPSSHSQFNCVNSWSPTVTGSTPDYFNNCQYISSGALVAGLTTYPDGKGAAGIIITTDYQEYISSCLNTPMLAGQEYRLKFNVASMRATQQLMNNCPINNTFGPMDLTLYGKADCLNIPVSGSFQLCPPAIDTAWIALGSVTYSPAAIWEFTTITFTPTKNINAISFGAPCNVPPTYPNGSINCIPYFLFDNFILNTPENVGMVNISTTGHYCTDNLVLNASIANNFPSNSLQWYHNGVAISGANSLIYAIPAGTVGLGSYQIAVSNGSTCALSSVYQVNTAPPVISVYNPTICPSSPFNLLATCSAINTFTWSTGAISNTISVNPNTTTIYTVSGTYGNCFSQATPTVTVIWGLSDPLTISATTLSVCSGATVGLTADNPGYVNHWNDGGSGYIIGATNGTTAVVKPFSTRTYTLSSVYNNPVGSNCQGKAMITISVTPISVSVTPNNIKTCPGRPITLTATGVNSYTWSNGANSNTTIVTPTINTTYTVTGSDGICTITATANIRADSVISITSNPGYYNLCPGASKLITAYGASSYTWSNGSNANQITVFPSSTTVYTVTGSIGYCTAQTTATINIVDLSLFPVTANTLICAGQSATIIAATWPSSINVNYHTLQGPGGLNTTFTSTNYVVSPTVTSNYVVGAHIQGSNCLPTTVLTISVVSQPSVSVNSPTICANQSAVLQATGATSYTWASGETTNTISINPVITTTYNVTGSITGCSISSAQTSTVFVNPLPNVFFNPIPIMCLEGATVNLSANPVGGIYSGIGVVSGVFDPIISGVGTFPITYNYTDIMGCSNEVSQTATVSLCTGIHEIVVPYFSVYPNPVSSILSVSASIEYSNIYVLNTMGQIIISTENKPTTISVSNLSNGIYFIQLLDKNGNLLKTEKFIKE